jgi:hypothetical protein
MVGIDVLTMVASMAKRKITSMTPKAARLRLRLACEVEVSDGFTSRSGSTVWFGNFISWTSLRRESSSRRKNPAAR